MLIKIFAFPYEIDVQIIHLKICPNLLILVAARVIVIHFGVTHFFASKLSMTHLKESARC